MKEIFHYGINGQKWGIRNGDFSVLDRTIDGNEMSKAVDISNIGAFDVKVGDINVNTK